MGDEEYELQRATKFEELAASGLLVEPNCWVSDPDTYAAVVPGCVDTNIVTIFKNMGYLEYERRKEVDAWLKLEKEVEELTLSTEIYGTN